MQNCVGIFSSCLPPCEKTPSLTFSPAHSPTLYRVDVERLRQTYKQLQRLLHPDMFSNRSPVSISKQNTELKIAFFPAYDINKYVIMRESGPTRLRKSLVVGPDAGMLIFPRIICYYLGFIINW